jgi:hypothetical protein
VGRVIIWVLSAYKTDIGTEPVCSSLMFHQLIHSISLFDTPALVALIVACWRMKLTAELSYSEVFPIRFYSCIYGFAQ